MTRINPRVTLEFKTDRGGKYISITQDGVSVYLKHETVESIVKNFFKYKAEIGDYPTLRQPSNPCTKTGPKIS